MQYQIILVSQARLTSARGSRPGLRDYINPLFATHSYVQLQIPRDFTVDVPTVGVTAAIQSVTETLCI